MRGLPNPWTFQLKGTMGLGQKENKGPSVTFSSLDFPSPKTIKDGPVSSSSPHKPRPSPKNQLTRKWKRRARNGGLQFPSIMRLSLAASQKRGGIGKIENTRGNIRKKLVLEDDSLIETEGTISKGTKPNLAKTVRQPHHERRNYSTGIFGSLGTHEDSERFVILLQRQNLSGLLAGD